MYISPAYLLLRTPAAINVRICMCGVHWIGGTQLATLRSALSHIYFAYEIVFHHVELRPLAIKRVLVNDMKLFRILKKHMFSFTKPCVYMSSVKTVEYMYCVNIIHYIFMLAI